MKKYWLWTVNKTILFFFFAALVFCCLNTLVININGQNPIINILAAICYSYVVSAVFYFIALYEQHKKCFGFIKIFILLTEEILFIYNSTKDICEEEILIKNSLEIVRLFKEMNVYTNYIDSDLYAKVVLFIKSDFFTYCNNIVFGRNNELDIKSSIINSSLFADQVDNEVKRIKNYLE